MQGYNSTDPISLAIYVSHWPLDRLREEDRILGTICTTGSFYRSTGGAFVGSQTPGRKRRVGLGGDEQRVTGDLRRNSSDYFDERSKVQGPRTTSRVCSEIYYQRVFAALTESTFERYKMDVETLIATHAGDVLKKIPAVISRLSEGEMKGKSGFIHVSTNSRGVCKRNLSADGPNDRTRRECPNARRTRHRIE